MQPLSSPSQSASPPPEKRTNSVHRFLNAQLAELTNVPGSLSLDSTKEEYLDALSLALTVKLTDPFKAGKRSDFVRWTLMFAIQKGADIRLKIDSNTQKTVLHHAAELGFVEVFTNVIKQCEDQKQPLTGQLNVQDREGNTPLMYAVMSGDLGLVE